MSDTPSLQTRLSQPYGLDVWQKILHGIFLEGTIQLFKTPETLSASREFVKATRQLGTIDLPDGNTSGLRTRIPSGISNTKSSPKSKPAPPPSTTSKPNVTSISRSNRLRQSS